MVDLMLDDLGGEALEGLKAGLHLQVLIAQLDFLIALSSHKPP